MSQFSADAGDYLIRQGKPPKGCYFIESGDIEIVTRMPGGGHLPLALAGAGDFIGEQGLIDGSPRSASSIVSTTVTGLYLNRQHFLASVALRQGPALALLRNIHVVLGVRMLSQINKLEKMFGQNISTSKRSGGSTAAVITWQDHLCTFDYRPFLYKLPFFKNQDSGQIEEIADQCSFVELRRGDLLYAKDLDSDACYVVVRGALTLFRNKNGTQCQISVLGPGRIVSVSEMIIGGVYQNNCKAKDNAVVMRLGKQEFQQIYQGDSVQSKLLLNAVSSELVTRLARLNDDLTLHSGYERLQQEI